MKKSRQAQNVLLLIVLVLLFINAFLTVSAAARILYTASIAALAVYFVIEIIGFWKENKR